MSINPDDDLAIDQNLFKNFEFNETKKKNDEEEILQGIPVKTTIVQDEAKRIKMQKMLK